MSGSAVLPSGILHHKIYRNERAMRLLVHLMLLSAQEESVLAPGQNTEAGKILRSVSDLAIALRWTRSKTVRALAALRAADAVKTQSADGGTWITCLYYATAPAPAKEPPAPKKSKKKEPIEDRVAQFSAACGAITNADPERLPGALRKEFHAYWTEPNKSGVMRFEAQPFFDHGRRMDTWRRTAEAKGFKHDKTVPHVKSDAPWNPRG